VRVRKWEDKLFRPKGEKNVEGEITTDGVLSYLVVATIMAPLRGWDLLRERAIGRVYNVSVPIAIEDSGFNVSRFKRL
jgi:hypothetical protein